MRQKPFKCKRVTCSAPFAPQYQRSETSVCLSCVSRVEWTWKHMNLYTMHIFRIDSRVVHPQTDATPRALQLLKSLSSLQFEQESQSVRMYSDFHSILFVKSSRFTNLNHLTLNNLFVKNSTKNNKSWRKSKVFVRDYLFRFFFQCKHVSNVVYADKCVCNIHHRNCVHIQKNRLKS